MVRLEEKSPETIGKVSNRMMHLLIYCMYEKNSEFKISDVVYPIFLLLLGLRSQV
jgi:hypothetical protein